MNRADPVLLEYMKYHIDNVDTSKGETYEKAKKFGQILIDNCKPRTGAEASEATEWHSERGSGYGYTDYQARRS